MTEQIKKIFRGFEPPSRFFYSLSPKAKVLDIGCGPGDNGLVLRSIHPEIELYGIDLLPKSEIPEFYNYSPVNLDEGRLPYPDEFFDAILFTHVIEHLRSPPILGKEIKRVMKKNAWLYVETPNWTSVLVPSFRFFRDQHGPLNFYDDPTHLRPWSKQSLFEYLFQACGLYMVKTGTVRNWLRLPFDPIIIFLGFLTRHRSYIISSFWNLYGWCIYGYGIKE
jgi:SAM-dependent methyltransferase